MNCPQDGSHLEQNTDSKHLSVSYDCPTCGGKFIKDSYINESDKYALYEPMVIPNYSGQKIECPNDKSIMLEEGNSLICHICHGSWKLGNKKPEKLGYDKKKITVIASEFVGLFIIAIGLFSWQLGLLNSSADPLQVTSQTPVKALVILIWFITFMLVFLLPATIYEQMVLSHRPHFTKASHHPLVRWLPVIIIVIMAVNIYFFNP